MIEIKNIHPIAIWTFWLWSERYEEWSTNTCNISYKEADINSLRFQHENWQNFIDASFIYAWWQTMKFLSTFFKTIFRDSIYISTKLENYANKPEDIEQQLDKYLLTMWIDFVDEFSMHTPIVSRLPINETYYHMQKLVDKGKVRYLWASNLSIEQLKSLCDNFDIKTFEWLYNLECKINENVWIIDFCVKENIRFISYQPFRRNRTANHNYPILLELSRKYNKTQNQIILNRIIKEKKLSAMIKTSNISRVKENLEALDFNISQEDFSKLNNFRCKEIDSLNVDRKTENWIFIRKLANQIK